MKNFYLPLFLAATLCFMGIYEAAAQKSLRIRISEYRNYRGTTSSLDCDGWLNDSDWEWKFNTTGNDPCFERDQNNFGVWYPNYTLWGTNYYYSRECWPGGNFSIGFRGYEDDGTSNCDQECSLNYSYTDVGYRAWNTTNGTYTDWNDRTYATSCNCPATVTYRYDAQQIVGGSYSGSNLDANTYVSNQTCATAVNLGSGTSLGATGNYVTQCRDTWYKFNLTSDRSDFTVNPSQNGSYVTIWYSPSGNTCSGHCYKTGGTGIATVRGAKAGWYFIRLGSSGGGNTNIAITSTSPSNDEIQFATTVTPSTGNFSFNNSGYSEQSGEPNPAGDIFGTGWYTFVTPAGGYNSLTASMKTNGCGAENIAIAIYRYTGTNCSNDFGTNLTTLASDRWCADNDDNITAYCLQGNTRHYVQFGTSSNFAACTDLLNGTPSTGCYTVSINKGVNTPTNDNICSAINLNSSVGLGYASGWQYFNNRCMSTQSGEPRTGSNGMHHTVWYKFTTNSNPPEYIDFEIRENNDGANNAGIAVYEVSSGCTFGALTERAYDWSCIDDGGVATVNCIKPNKTYFIQAGTAKNSNDGVLCVASTESNGGFRMRMTASSYGLGTDNICSVPATPSFTINSSSGSHSINQQSNICAGTESGEPSGGQKTVWYKFTTGATVPKNVTFNMDAKTNGLNADIDVYEACSGTCAFGNLNRIADWYDVNPLIGEFDAGGTLSGEIRPNMTYYIRADGVPTVGVDGGFDIDISWGGTYPAYDNICSARNFGQLDAGDVFTHSGNNDNHTKESYCSVSEPGGQDNTVWYTFTTGAIPPTTIYFDVDAGGVCTGWAQLYRGSPTCPMVSTSNGFSGLTYLEDIDVGVGDNYDCPPANTTFYMQVDITGLCTTGSYSMEISAPNASKGADLCSGAIDLGTLNSGGSLNSGHYSNVCATGTGESVSCSWSVDKGVWFKFNSGTASGPINFDANNTLNDDIDIQIAVFDGSCGSLNELDCEQFPSLTLCVDGLCDEDLNDVCVQANTDYWVLIDGGGATGALTQGIFNLNINHSGVPEAPDLCANAVDLGTLNVGNTLSSGNYSNICATGTGESVSCLWGVQAGVWFKFNTGTAGGYLNVDANNVGGDDIDIQVALFTGSCGSLTEVGCDFFPGEPICATSLCDEDLNDMCVQPNTDYWILIDGGGAVIGALERGIFNVNVIDKVEPANDLACGAFGLAVPPASGGGPQIAAPPFNNNYTVQGRTAQNNTGGTNCWEPDPDWTLSSNNHGVWYKTTAPGRTLVLNADNTGSDAIDIKLAVYQNSAGPDDCNLDNSSGSGNPDYFGRDYDPVIYDEDYTEGLFGAAAVICLDPTKDVYIMVDGAGDLINTDEGEFSLRTYHPYEGGTDWCDYDPVTNWDGTRDLGPYVDGGTMTIRNLSNFCGFGSIPGPPGTAADPAFLLEKGVLFKFQVPPTEAIGEGSVKITATSDPVIGSALGLGSGDEISLELAVYEENAPATCGQTFSLVKSTVGASAVLDGFNEELIVNCLSPGIDYYLLVDGTTVVNQQGFFELKFEDYGITTPNDDQCNAIPFTTDLTELGNWRACNSNTIVTLSNQNNYCGTTASEPNPSAWPASAHMVWYKFEAPFSGKLEIRLDVPSGVNAFIDDDYINGMLAVYDLPDGEDICTYNFTAADEIISDYDLDVPPVSQGEDMEVECLIPGRTYYLAVDGEAVTALGGEDWDAGEFSIEFESDPRDPPAPNNDICNATHLGTVVHGGGKLKTVDRRTSAPYNTTPYSCMRAENNWCSDLETGEPDPSGAVPPFGGGFGINNTVWYSFVAPNYSNTGVGAVRIDALSDPGSLGDGIDLQIAVFENVKIGSGCNGLLDSLITANADYDPLIWDETIEVQCLNAGDTYYIMVDGADAPLLTDEEGYFELEIESIPVTEVPPPNDDICDAVNMTGMWPTIGTTISDDDETNRCALLEVGIPEPSTFGRDHTVWYKFTTPAGGTTHALEGTVISDWPWPFGDAMDPQIALYESSDGTCSGTITENFSDYGLINVPFTETSEFYCLEPATTYWLMVDGSSLNSQGNFDVDLTSITPKSTTINNICDAAPGQPGDLGQITTLTGSVSSGAMNNYCADLEAGEPDTITSPLIDYKADNTVWLSFVTPSSPGNNFSIDFDANSLGGSPQNDGLNLQVAIYQSSDGTCSGTMSEIDAGFDPILWDEDVNNVCLAQNTRYWVQIDGWQDGIAFTTDEWRGFFDLTISSDGVTGGPANDNICNATSLAVSGTTLTLGSENNDCATVEPGEPGVGTYASRTVWYSFVAPTSADVTINVDGNNCFLPFGGGIDPEIHLFSSSDNTCSGTLTEIDNSYIPLNCLLLDEEITPLCLHPGDTYFLQVDGSDLFLDGDFTLTIVDNQPAYTGPTNNFCAGAIDLTTSHLTGPNAAKSCFYSSRSFDTENYGDATWSMDPSGSCGQNCGETWYKFQMPATEFAKIEGTPIKSIGLNGSGLNIVAYDAGPTGSCASMTQVDCGSAASLTGEDIEYSVTADAGDWIFLQVFNEGGTDMNEDFEICIIEQCSADECTDLSVAGVIEFDSFYCFNLETMTAEPASESYTVGVANGDPTHSTYFQFDTDDFCGGYIMHIDIADIDVNDRSNCFATLPYNTLTISVIEDPTPCDNTPVAKTIVYEKDDCLSGDIIAQEITLLLGDVITSNIPNKLYDDFKQNTTYIIQIDVTGAEVSPGTLMIEKMCKGREWDYTDDPLLPLKPGSYVSDGYCTDALGWRHYYDDGGTATDYDDDYLMFSIKPNSNDFDATVTIDIASSIRLATSQYGPEASYVMRRLWDVDVVPTSPDYNTTTHHFTNPVDVRFYYQDSEKAEVEAAAQAFATLNTITYEPFEWFKSEDGVDFDATQWIYGVQSGDIKPPVVVAYYGSGSNAAETGASATTPTAAYGFTGGDPFGDMTVEDHTADPTNETCNGISYVEITGLRGFSGGSGTAGAGPGGSPLPVELISFIGWNDGDVNQLEWVTASEINNDKFIVTHSRDGVNFTEIGEVDGNGTSTEEITYNFTHVSPSIGRNYYQLIQVDFDGTTDRSDVVVIDVGEAQGLTRLARLYPNPTNDVLNVEFEVDRSSKFEFMVIDVTGKIVASDILSLDRNLHRIELDVSKYANGNYLISVSDLETGEQYQAKFLKEE